MGLRPRAGPSPGKDFERPWGAPSEEAGGFFAMAAQGVLAPQGVSEKPLKEFSDALSDDRWTRRFAAKNDPGVKTVRKERRGARSSQAGREVAVDAVYVPWVPGWPCRGLLHTLEGV